MEAGLVQAPSFQTSSEIPRAIYQPLLEIAQHGYNANDIKDWYLTISRQIHRIGSENAEAAYNLITTASESFPSFLTAPPVRLLNGDEASNVKNTSSQNSGFDFWSDSFSFDPFQGTQLQSSSATPAQSIYQSPNHERQNSMCMSAQWSPSPSTGPEIDVNELSTAANEAAAMISNVTNSSPWFSPGSFSMPNEPPRSRQTSCSPSQIGTSNSFVEDLSQSRHQSYSPPYHMAMSNAAMPMLMPCEQRQPSPMLSNAMPTSLGLSFPSSTGLYSTTFPPPITIIPSRKRRKTLQKGVKKIIQPMNHHHHRGSI